MPIIDKHTMRCWLLYTISTALMNIQQPILGQTESRVDLQVTTTANQIGIQSVDMIKNDNQRLTTTPQQLSFNQTGYNPLNLWNTATSTFSPPALQNPAPSYYTVFCHLSITTTSTKDVILDFRVNGISQGTTTVRVHATGGEVTYMRILNLEPVCMRFSKYRTSAEA